MVESTREISVVGYATRLPSAPDNTSFWRMLESGTCAVSQVSPDRWPLSRFLHPDPSARGRTYTWAAGQIEKPWDFDPAFFGISPRETIQTDPQQRLLLQLVWEALENAGIAPDKLAGLGTGVYVGASALDYSHRFLLDPSASDIQFMTGNTLSIISNRISYIYDLRGPSFTVDTACSSSLVALHEASEAIRSGRIDTAIVAGVNMLLSPFAFIGFSRASMLSPTGLCRAFDASGDGYVRSEGGVVVVLQSADAARRAGNVERARLVATGLNSDGRTVGMSLPSGETQAELLRDVYRDHGLDPNDLAFVEAHGTGTQVGDPAEAFSLGTSLGRKRTSPLPIGSIKTNIGHLEPASGLAGMVKAICALEHDLFPRSLHFDKPNPNIDFADLNLTVAGDAVPLERGSRPRLAGINSFGFGGTNAHAVISDPVRTLKPEGGSANAPLVLSAASQDSLRALATRYADHLETLDDGLLAPTVSSAAHTRQMLSQRLVVLDADPDGRIKALRDFAANERNTALAQGKAGSASAPVIFAFTGNGSQWAGMGRLAYRHNSRFRDAFDRIDRSFMRIAGWSLATTLYSEDLDTDIERTEIAQPLLFGIQGALVDALEHLGVTPDAVIGHSVGEVAAAWTAGALDLDDAVRIIHARSSCQEITRHLGSMAALLLSGEDAQNALDASGLPGLQVAAINSPRSVTISGPGESLDAFAKFARKNRWALRRLDIAYPFHCALVDPIEQPLREALADIKPRTPRRRFVSTVFPDSDDPVFDAGYWWENVRRPVLFTQAMDRLMADGGGVIVEIGPTPILTTYIRDITRDSNRPATIVSSLDRKDETPDALPRIAAEIFANGGKIDRERLFGVPPRTPAPLPGYAWDNQTYRPEETSESVGAFTGHTWTLLGYRLNEQLLEWFNVVDPQIIPFLGDHRVEDSAVFPGAGYIEMALRAARMWLDTDAVEIRDMDILRPLVFEDDAAFQTRLRISPDDGVFEIHSRPRLEEGEWSLNVRGSLGTPPSAGSKPRLEARTETASELDRTGLYELTRRFGLNYGPAFQRGSAVTAHDTRHATLELEEPVTGHTDFSLDPTLLDAGFHGLFALLDAAGEVPGQTSFLPVRVGRLRLHGDKHPVRVRLRVEKASPRSIEASFEFLDADDGLVARLTGARFRAMVLGRADNPGDLVYRTIHHVLPLPGAASVARQVIPDAATLLPQESDTEPAETLLLLEAMTQRIAFDALQPLADEDGIITPSSLADANRLAENAQALATSLLLWLADHGHAEEDGDGWKLPADIDLPETTDLLRLLTREAPERVAELALLSRLAADLPALLSDGLAETAGAFFSGALLEQFRNASPTSLPLSETLRDALAGAIDRWPDEDPLRILVMGAGNTGLLQDIAARLKPENATLTVSDTDPSELSRAARNWSGPALVRHVPLDDILANDGDARFDIVAGTDLLARLGADRLEDLRDRMAPDALLLTCEYMPSPLFDLLLGSGTDWWSASTDPRFPITAQRSPDQWARSLEDAGFGSVRHCPVPGGSVEASIFAAHAPLSPVATQPSDTDATDETVTSRRAVLVHDDATRALADALSGHLERAGHAVSTIVLGDATLRTADGAYMLSRRAEDLEAPAGLKEMLTGDDVDLVHLAGAFPDASDAMAAADRRLTALKAMLRHIGGETSRLWLVAPGAMQQGLQDMRPALAATWGFGRTAMNEYPSADIRLLDVAPSLQPGEMAVRLAEEILQPTEDREIVRDMDHRKGLRLLRGGLPDDGSDETVTGEAALRLDIDHQGSLDYLRWRPVARLTPADGEIEIAVRASGLNFRDVMWALGLLPEEALEDGFAGPTLGMECSGEVTRVGAGVSRFKPGDRVLTFAPACFSSHLTVAEIACAPMPSTVDFEAAATIPVTFLTAYYALVELGRLGEGETVLIHGGAGGVGLAAIQIAQWRGATIIATAGSAEKRAYLRLLGVDHVLDSRSLDFAEEVFDLTGSVGVDVVLNSLFGEAMERSIETLRPFGRFLELGKRDYFGNTRIGLRPFRQNLSYFGIDADQLLTRQPRLAERMFADLVALFEDGTLAPLPYRLFDPHTVVDAFRVMQQSGHIGKIVLRPPKAPEPATEVAAHGFASEGTHVVAGGFGGFGAELLRWLADRGVRHMLVMSRSGPRTEAASDLIEELSARGVDIRGIACDVTNSDALSAALATARAEMPPITGVYHTAMVINDALLANMTDSELSQTLLPKIRGAENLDRLTADDPVKTFVLYSSATTLVGNPGQANYVAANAYLEALAIRRRAAGKPALAIAWGAISDAGYLARNEDVGELLARKLGRHSLTASEALNGLGLLLAQGGQDTGMAATAFARIDWSAAQRDLALLSTPLISLLGLSASGQEMDGDGMVDLKALLEGLDANAAIQTVARLLAGEIGRILRIAPEELDPHRPLSEIGMDSLMALELRMAAERQLGVDIPLMSLANGATLHDLASRIASKVTDGDTGPKLSSDARNLAGQHFGGSGDLAADEAEELASRVEERSGSVGKLVQ